MNFRFAAVACAILLAASAAQSGVMGAGQTALGPVLTDDKGMTLYTFDKDGKGMSSCVDACAQNWPPMMAAKGDKAMGEYSIVTRPDGSMQWAYRGKPLYRWSKDMKPGDTLGEGFKDIWHVARP